MTINQYFQQAYVHLLWLKKHVAKDKAKLYRIHSPFSISKFMYLHWNSRLQEMKQFFTKLIPVLLCWQIPLNHHTPPPPRSQQVIHVMGRGQIPKDWWYVGMAQWSLITNHWGIQRRGANECAFLSVFQKRYKMAPIILVHFNIHKPSQ